MPTTLSYGYIKPQTGDKGSSFFPVLEQNIQQVNDHTHNGTNSAPLTPASVASVAQTLLAANWVLVSGGLYRQLVTMPGSFQFENQFMRFLLNTAPYVGHEIYPSLEKVTANTFYVYINDNTMDVKVLYR